MKILLQFILILLVFVGCADDKTKTRKSTVEQPKAKTEVAAKASGEGITVTIPKKAEAKKTISPSKSEEEASDPIPKEQLAVARKLITDTKEKLVEGVDAAKVFKMSCAICHGRKGNMSINGAKVLTKTKTSLTERVAQVYFGKGTMTPFKGILKDHEIIAVADYIDELKKKK